MTKRAASISNKKTPDNFPFHYSQIRFVLPSLVTNWTNEPLAGRSPKHPGPGRAYSDSTRRAHVLFDVFELQYNPADPAHTVAQCPR